MSAHSSSSTSSWSNRIVMVALAGIFFLTFYPFAFTYPGSWRLGASPFLLNSVKGAGLKDDFLNVLLFMPFGFGLAEKLRGRKISWGITTLLVYVAGALLSYGVEFTQLFIPNRDSGWHDVITNSAGAAAGALVFLAIGPFLIRILENTGDFLHRYLTIRRAAIAVLVYLALWFAVSASLQKQTRLTNWNSDSVLMVANDAAGQQVSLWKGAVFRLQLWNRAFPKTLATQIPAMHSRDLLQYTPVAEYDFSAPPYRDRMNRLPNLSWADPRLIHAADSAAASDSKLGLISQGPVDNLVNRIKTSDQFSIRLVCKPASAGGVDARIVSISHSPRFADLQLRQQNSHLLLWLRTPLTVRTALVWDVPGVFTAAATRDILFSYDGSSASLYIDGQPLPNKFVLGPGAALARVFRDPRLKELQGYEYIYYALGFFPAGILLGVFFRQLQVSLPISLLLIAADLLAISLLFDLAMHLVCGRFFSLPYVALSVVYMVLGMIWLHADKSSARSPACASSLGPRLL